MANTYTELHIQLVFAVKYRQALILPEWEEELYKYITGIIHNKEHQVLAIKGMSDHVHLLMGWRPNQSISSLMQDIKAGSSSWINKHKMNEHLFRWQEGYGAFSYSKSQLNIVKSYIMNQKEHHRKKSFVTEYKELLEENGIVYDEKYIFHEPL